MTFGHGSPSGPPLAVHDFSRRQANSREVARMSTPKTTMDGPVRVTLPSAPPDPVSGCRECLRYAVARANATSVGDYSQVSDVNVGLRAHGRNEHGMLMARTVLRFVTHRITQHPDTDVTYEAECLHRK